MTEILIRMTDAQNYAKLKRDGIVKKLFARLFVEISW